METDGIAVKLEPPPACSQDRVAVFQSESSDVVVVVIADGAGGQGGGKHAAVQVVDAVQTFTAGDEDLLDPRGWCEAFRRIDKTIYHDRLAGESTAVAIAIGPTQIVGVSVGDSEAWLVCRDGWEDLTGAQQRKRMGSGFAQPVTFAVTRRPGVVVAGSDGLFHYIGTRELLRIVRESTCFAAAEALRDAARLPSGGFADDFSVVVVPV